MKLIPFNVPANSRQIRAIEYAYTSTFLLWMQTPRWRLLLRARLLREYELYLKLLIRAIESKKLDEPAMLTTARMLNDPDV